MKGSTKNLDGPAFEKCSRTLVGQDVHIKSYTSEQGGCQEGSQGTQKGIPILIKEGMHFANLFYIFE